VAQLSTYRGMRRGEPLPEAEKLLTSRVGSWADRESALKPSRAELQGLKTLRAESLARLV